MRNERLQFGRPHASALILQIDRKSFFFENAKHRLAAVEGEVKGHGHEVIHQDRGGDRLNCEGSAWFQFRFVISCEARSPAAVILQR